MPRKRILLAVLFATIFPSLAVRAAEPTADERASAKLVGKWTQTLEIPTLQGGKTKMVVETVFLKNGKFSAIATSGPYKFFSEGRWSVKDGILTQQLTDWFPKKLKNVDGSETTIIVPETESTQIEFPGENRLRNKLGEAQRVPNKAD